MVRVVDVKAAVALVVKAAALAEAAALAVVVVFRAVIITPLGGGGGDSGMGSGCKDKIKGQGLWAGSFQPAGCHYLQPWQDVELHSGPVSSCDNRV